ncbi:MAG: penicillin-binding transpeptidase domain-containing protein [Bacilli bacterium]
MLNKKRIIGIGIAFLLGFVMLVLRHAQISLIQTTSFSEHRVDLVKRSVEQRMRSVSLNDGRGVFVARDGEPFTRQAGMQLVVFPFALANEAATDAVASLIGYSSTALRNMVEAANGPTVIPLPGGRMLTPREVQRIEALNVAGVYALNRSNEVDSPLALHTIGLVRENPEQVKSVHKKAYDAQIVTGRTLVGINGLERAFDSLIVSSGERRLQYQIDARGEPLFRANIRMNDRQDMFFPLTVRTTMDYTLQSAVEEIVRASEIKKGGVVVLDVESNEVRAIVSAPLMDKNNPYPNGEAAEGSYNYPLMRATPGSVMKTVVAAAAIETIPDINERTYDCSQNVYGDGIEPNEKRRFGILSVEASFARSCNRTFASLSAEMEKQSPGILALYAKRLGMSERVGWQGALGDRPYFAQFPEEERNQWYPNGNDRYNARAMMQTGIGQRDVQVTPLALANMMRSIAHGGQPSSVRVVSDVRYRNDVRMFGFSGQPMDVEPLKKETLEQLRRYLITPVTSSEGTARALSGLSYSVAGKTGTAEQPTADGKSDYNKWFAGYFPADKPKYSIVTFELQTEDEHDASYIRVARDIIERFYAIDHVRKLEEARQQWTASNNQ